MYFVTSYVTFSTFHVFCFFLAPSVIVLLILGRLHRKAKQFAMRNFSKVSKQEEFLRLSLPAITKYLADDQLVAKREEHIYDAALRWLEVFRFFYKEEI